MQNVDHIDIICLSLARWDAPISSPAVSLAKSFAKTNRVFFIDHPFSWKDRLLQKHSESTARSGFEKEGSNDKEAFNQNLKTFSAPSTIPINFLPAGRVYNYLQSKNNSKLFSLTRTIIEEYRISNWIFINFFDPFFLQQLPPDLKPIKMVYQCMDDISQVAYTAKHGLRLEEQIIREYDLTLCTSRELTAIKSRLSSTVHFLPNAVDYELFKTAFDRKWDRPDDLPPGKQIIGYTGSLEYRTDILLLTRIASHHHDKIVFIVGPVALPETDKDALSRYSNIVFAGARRIEQLPAYLQYFDCAVIPFRKNTLTKSIYPLKLNEYLAAGLPVISTDFSEDIRQFADLVYLSTNSEEFVQNISNAIAEDEPAKRIARATRASTNNWDARVKEFWSLCNIS